jgi:peptidoglycan/xylan/chitin deacetylase (PgdA/CDA1 family)
MLRGVHHVRNPETLTVLGYHRVLPAGDPRWRGAMPGFTIEASFFEASLRFAQKHYNVVDMARVIESKSGSAPLPPRALTITFDDGWADTFEVALPILHKLGLPSTVFVTPTGVTGEGSFWREELFAAHRLLGKEAVTEVTHGASADHADSFDFVAWAEALEEEPRNTMYARVLEAAGDEARAAMMSVRQLEVLASEATVGGHGWRHDWLVKSPDPLGELGRSRSELAALCGREDDAFPETMSFPHGRYDAGVVEAVRDQGFELAFTSDHCLNRTRDGRLHTDILGRVFVGPTRMAEQGVFSPALAANVMFRAPIDELDGVGPRHF